MNASQPLGCTGLHKTVNNLRTYGKQPYTIAVIHGGPGAAGHMAPVARELSAYFGILEPLQTVASVMGQVEELRDVLVKHGNPPLTLIGSSWGAMLGFIFSAYYPALITKLILVGSGAFEEGYAVGMMDNRLNRLSDEERTEAFSLIETLDNPSIKDKDSSLSRLGTLMTKADAYDPLTLDTENIEINYHIYHSVWNEAEELRRSGILLKLGDMIQCPVVAIHGDYDPHPYEGVRKPLSDVLRRFQFILLKNCGHLPWIEREAQSNFYQILKQQILISI